MFAVNLGQCMGNANNVQASSWDLHAVHLTDYNRLQLPVSQFYQQQTMYPGHMVRHQHSPMAQANTKCRRQPRKQHATSQLSLLSHYLGQQQPSLVTSSTETPQNPAHVLARPTEQLSMVGCGGCLQESTAGTAGQTAGLID